MRNSPSVNGAMVVQTACPAQLVDPSASQSSGAFEVLSFRLDDRFRWSAAAGGIETLVQRPAAAILRRPLAEFVHPEDLSNLQLLLDSAAQGRSVGLEFRLLGRNDESRWVQCHLLPTGGSPPIEAFFGVLVDMQARKEAEEELIARERRYHRIVEEMHEGYFETDLQGILTFCNQTILNLSGYDRDELIGRSYRGLTVPRSRHPMQAMFGHILKSGRDSKSRNFEVFHKEGHTIFIEFGASLIRGAEGEPVGFRGILRDVSEEVKSTEREKRLQSQLQQAQKMEALGTLAGGLAHGFNNVLMAIQGNLSLMRMTLTADHPMQKHLERINQSTEKGVDLAKQILSFAKMGKFVVMPTNLNKILKSTSRMFVRNKPNVRIHEYYTEDLWETEVDRVQIGQVLLSLYVNGVEGMPDGGDLYLQSENVILDESYTQPHDLEAGRFVKISVTDSGNGLSEESRRRLFEPFFSVNRPGRIDSLGLAAVYGTVKSHKGIINAYSEKSQGTTITIYLPVSRKERALPQLQPVIHGSETILVVDDDEAAAGSGKEILERSGYRALTAATGIEAIEVFRKYEKQIDLVLLDVILPDLDAMNIFQQLREISPRVRVLLASGYNRNKQIGNLLRAGCADFIQKPFQSQPLRAKVRSALDGVVDADSTANDWKTEIRT